MSVEDGYLLDDYKKDNVIKNMTFDCVLKALREGKKARELGWEKGSFIEILDNNYGKFISFAAKNEQTVWSPLQYQLLSDEWEVVEEV